MLAAQTLIDPNDEVVVEDPGFTYMSAAFAAVGAQITPVSVDDHGLDVEELEPASTPKMIGVTPSHQFPLGMTMGLSRRLALLEYATSNDVWILEDDYDSEFRYSGEPIAALQGLDNGGRVIYTGSFSKVLFPALRLGYLVAPPDVVPHITRMRAVNDRCPPRIVQMVLSDFLTEGYFYEHIREMRTLYKSRQRVLIDALTEEFGDFFQVRRKDAGLHLVAWLPKGVDDQSISQTLDEADLVAPPISHFFDNDVERGALLLGFAGVNESEICNSVEHMARVLSKYL
jgi:GntR family transcriptional regulator/MocR family aminotransferase